MRRGNRCGRLPPDAASPRSRPRMTRGGEGCRDHAAVRADVAAGGAAGAAGRRAVRAGADIPADAGADPGTPRQRVERKRHDADGPGRRRAAELRRPLHQARPGWTADGWDGATSTDAAANRAAAHPAPGQVPFGGCIPSATRRSSSATVMTSRPSTSSRLSAVPLVSPPPSAAGWDRPHHARHRRHVIELRLERRVADSHQANSRLRSNSTRSGDSTRPRQRHPRRAVRRHGCLDGAGAGRPCRDLGCGQDAAIAKAGVVETVL